MHSSNHLKCSEMLRFIKLNSPCTTILRKENYHYHLWNFILKDSIISLSYNNLILIWPKNLNCYTVRINDGGGVFHSPYCNSFFILLCKRYALHVVTEHLNCYTVMIDEGRGLFHSPYCNSLLIYCIKEMS